MEPDNNVAPWSSVPRASSPYSTDVDLAHSATQTTTDETMDFDMDVDMDAEVDPELAAMQKAAAELHAVRGHFSKKSWTRD